MSNQPREIIERMITMGYSDEDITLRLRRPLALVQDIRRQMPLENLKDKVNNQDNK